MPRLILTRRVGEKLIIDTGHEVITVTPVTIDGRQVKIAVEAPDHVAVNREEIHLRKQADKNSNF